MVALPGALLVFEDEAGVFGEIVVFVSFLRIKNS
jgi:hypothetical protein